MTAKTLHLVSGNQLQILADALAEEFFCPSSTPFQNRLVVVPHMGLKDYLFQHLALHSKLKIAAGIKILPFEGAIREILGNKTKKVPSFLELSLCVEEQLYVQLEKTNFSSLRIYFDVEDEEKRARRIAAMSDELARLFGKYGTLGAEFLSAWLKGQGWQQDLWNALFCEESRWTFPLEVLKQKSDYNYQGKIALFGFSYLSPAHLDFFSNYTASLYQLSACSQFWQDFTSDKERMRTKKALKAQGAAQNVQEEMDEYMLDGHTILGNFGKLGRQFLKALESVNLIEKECYVEPISSSLLTKLKRSILHLEPEIFTSDHSIQLHSATSKLREVEVLRSTLETIISENKEFISLNEILVVSPNMAAYAPFIEMVFSSSPFHFTIDAIPTKRVSKAVRGFLQLVELGTKRFALSEVMQFLRCSSLKSAFKEEEIQNLNKWFKIAKIRRDLSGHPNSWEEGLDRILTAFSFETIVPYSEIDLFNRFLELFSDLKKDLALLALPKSHSDWLDLFLCVANKYFILDLEKEPFFQELKRLKNTLCTLNQTKCPFPSVARVLHFLGSKPSTSPSGSQLEKIRFNTLTQGALTPARIVWCLGMNEEAFPRTDTKSSLCEMSRLKAKDYCPSKADEDRFLFLEMLLMAKSYLIFSYERVHPEDGKQQAPSILIEELSQYTQGIQKIDHPAFALDRCYHSAKKEGASFFAYSDTTNYDETVDISKLKKLARHPLQFYFNETLKIFLKEQEDEEHDEFLISNLQKAIYRKKALKETLPQIVSKMNTGGHMPRGLFGAASQLALEEEVSELVATLGTFHLSPEQIQTIHFSPYYYASDNQLFMHEPLKIVLSNSQTVQITGKLEGVTQNGLVVHADSSLKSLLKIWPLYLIYCCMQTENRSLILTKSGEKKEFVLEDPHAALASYLEYYFLAKNSPSPFTPEWAKIVMQGDEEELQKRFFKDYEDDPYFNYLRRKEATLKIDKNWSNLLTKICAPLYEL